MACHNLHCVGAVIAMIIEATMHAEGAPTMVGRRGWSVDNVLLCSDNLGAVQSRACVCVFVRPTLRTASQLRFAGSRKVLVP